MKMHLTKKRYERAFSVEGMLLLLTLLIATIVVVLWPERRNQTLVICILALGTMFIDVSLYDYVGEKYGYHESVFARWFCIAFGTVCIVMSVWATICWCGPFGLDVFGLTMIGKFLSSAIFAGELLKNFYKDNRNFREENDQTTELCRLSFSEYAQRRQ